MINIDPKFYKNKKILVTGSTGFIGTNLCLRLLDLGADVVGTYFKSKPKIITKKIKYLQADLTNKIDCTKVCKNIDYVFMCAANTSGAQVIENEPLSHLTPNIVMNAFMLEAAYSNNVKKFIFISSNTVYPEGTKAMTENDVNYTFFYKYHIVGWMKAFSEEMCNMYLNHISKPMKTLVIRPGNLYGPYDKFNPKESKVIAALIKKFADKENPIIVWGDGNDIKDFLYIDDFITGLLSVSSKKDSVSPVNIASGKKTTVKNIINHLKHISKIQNPKIIYDSSKPTMIPIRRISTRLAKEKFNFKCRYSINEGLEKTFNWYQNNRSTLNNHD